MRNMDVFKGTTGSNLTDLDIIEELITEDRECVQSRSTPGSRLPGPPPPPADLVCEPQNHRMLGSGLNSTEPVLVARGTVTAPRARCSFPQSFQPSTCSREMASAHPCRGASPSGSSRRGRGPLCQTSTKNPMGASSQAQTGTEMLECILEKPRLVVVEEPKERGMRFRYECEGRSAGSILGASSTVTTKSQPAIEIQGPIDHLKKVTVTVSLVTKDIPYRPHPHCLVGKDCPESSGICLINFNPHNSRRHSFANLGIQCVRRKELDASLEKRRNQHIDPFRTGQSKSIEDMDMNVVRLCFQCELEWEDGRKGSLSPVVSNPIYDKKATTTSQLKISCLNLYKGPCTGMTEIYMLCDKVQKDDIEIIFKHESWEAKGEFAQTDVHRQIAIVFKSPPYQEQDITEEVEVELVLRRISDRMDSEPITFTYLPHNPDPYQVKRKRKIKTDISFSERSCVAAQSSAAMEDSSSHAFPVFPVPDSKLERLPPARTDISALRDLSYNDHQDTTLSTQNYEDSDELTILSQLMEIPSFQEMLSDPAFNTSMSSGFDQGPNANTYGHMDANFVPYGQDFSQYNDLHFNHMVNESQTTQSEPLSQETPPNEVQVKTEENL